MKWNVLKTMTFYGKVENSKYRNSKITVSPGNVTIKTLQ